MNPSSEVPQAEKLAKVREFIFKACPELRVHKCFECDSVLGPTVPCHECGSEQSYTDESEIRIAEVLRSLQRQPQLVVMDRWGQLEYFRMGALEEKAITAQWELADDSLDHQSPETISFLFSLIP